MFSTGLSFPISKSVTEHCCILVPEAVGFSKSNCHHVLYRERYIYERKVVTLFPSNMLHENTELVENFRFPLFTQSLKKIKKVILV